MKLLFVIDSLSKGGKERQMLELIKGLIESNEKFDICLVVLSENIEYEYVYDLGIRLEIIKRKYKKDWGVIFKLKKIVKSFKPDVVHSWDTMASVYLSLLGMFVKIKLINNSVLNAYPNLNFSSKHYMRVKLTAPFSKVIVANSFAGIEAYRLSSKKTVCIYNGIDFSRFENLKDRAEVERTIPDLGTGKKFVSIMVGAFEDRKDYPTLVEAAVRLCYKRSDVIFLLVGDGSGMEAVKAMVPAQFLDKQIFFLGKRKDVESLLQICDAGLLISPCEGLSNSIIEYMASEKPVIASRGGGTSELVNDGVTGFLVDQKKPEQIIEKIEVLIAHPELCKEMGKKGSKWVRDHLDNARITNTYIALYKRVSNNR